METNVGADVGMTSEVREVLGLARELVTLERTDALTVEHLLLAIVRRPQCRAFQALSMAGVAPSEVEQALAPRRPRNFGPKAGVLPYTRNAKRVLEAALANAQKDRRPEVDTVDLLVGIVEWTAPGRHAWLPWNRTPRATQLLNARGVTAARISACR